MVDYSQVVICALVTTAGCAFSSHQSARMLPQGNSQVGVAVNSYGYHSDGESADEEAIELLGSHGISDQFELGGKLAWFSAEDEDFFNLLVMPKISIIPDQLAFVAQTGLIFATGEDDSDNVWMTMPGVVYTAKLTDTFSLDLTGKLVALFEDDFSDYNMAGALNFGVRLAPPGYGISIGPEIGFLYDDDAADEGDTGYFLQIGLAVQYEFGPTRTARPSSTTAPPAAPPPAPAPAPPPMAPPAPEPAPVPEPAPAPPVP